MLIADAFQAASGAVERLFPSGLAEMRPRIGGIDLIMRVLGHAILADQRHGQAMRMAHIVEAEAALESEPVSIGRPAAAVGIEQPVRLVFVGKLATTAALRADAFDSALVPGAVQLMVVD